VLINALDALADAREAFPPGLFGNVLHRGGRPERFFFHEQGAQLPSIRFLDRPADPVARRLPLRVREVARKVAKKRGNPYLTADYENKARVTMDAAAKQMEGLPTQVTEAAAAEAVDGGEAAEDVLEDEQTLAEAVVELARSAQQVMEAMDTTMSAEAATVRAVRATVAAAQASEAAEALAWAAVKFAAALFGGSPEEAAADEVSEAAVGAAEAWEDAQELAVSAVQVARAVRVAESTEAAQTAEALEAATEKVAEIVVASAKGWEKTQALVQLIVQLACTLSAGAQESTGAAQAAKNAEAMELAVAADAAEPKEVAVQAVEVAKALAEAASEFAMATNSGNPEAVAEAMEVFNRVCVQMGPDGEDVGCLT